MAFQFEADFHQNLISRRGSKLDRDPFTDVFSKALEERCHQFSVKGDISSSPGLVQLVPGKTVKLEWLYGPAMTRASQRIVYPCSRFKCLIPCPCLRCEKKHPKCRIPATQACSCKDCKTQFDDHSIFHRTFHFGCKFCAQLIRIFPSFNFFFLMVTDTEKVKERPSVTDHIVTKPLVADVGPRPKYTLELIRKISNREDVGGIWCNECDIIFWSLGQLTEHIKLNHLGIKLFRHDYITNEKKVTGEFKCFQCSTYYKSSTDLNRHVDSVHYQETFECDSCAKVFTRKDNLTQHKKTSHMEGNNPLECDKCGHTFNRRDKYITHRNKKNSECSVCHEQFCFKKDLDEHMKKIHDGIRCEVCDLKFSRRDSLKKHIEDYSPSNCDTCSLPFCNSQDLRNHKSCNHLLPLEKK